MINDMLRNSANPNVLFGNIGSPIRNHAPNFQYCSLAQLMSSLHACIVRKLLGKGGRI